MSQNRSAKPLILKNLPCQSLDTSGIETYVTENNPKYLNRILIQLKAFKKANQLPDGGFL
jgi:hypothetical protein